MGIRLLHIPVFNLGNLVLGQLIQAPWQKLAHEHRLVDRFAMLLLPQIRFGDVVRLRQLLLDLGVDVLHDGIQRVGQLLVGIPKDGAGDELEQLAGGHDVESAGLAEVVVDVGAVLPEEVEGRGMVALHALADVDDVDLPAVPEEVVLGQVPVDQLAPLEHPAHDGDGLHVRLAEPPLAEVGVADAGAGPSVPSQKFHNEDVALEEDRPGTADAGRVDAAVVAQFLFGPRLDHLAGIGLAISLPPPMLSGHVLVAILEDQDGRLEDLDGKFVHGLQYSGCVWVLLGRGSLYLGRHGPPMFAGLGVVHVGLLARRQTSVNLIDKGGADQFEQNQPSARIQNLLGSGPIVPSGVLALFCYLHGAHLLDRVVNAVRHVEIDLGVEADLGAGCSVLGRREGTSSAADIVGYQLVIVEAVVVIFSIVFLVVIAIIFVALDFIVMLLLFSSLILLVLIFVASLNGQTGLHHGHKGIVAVLVVAGIVKLASHRGRLNTSSRCGWDWGHARHCRGLGDLFFEKWHWEGEMNGDAMGDGQTVILLVR